jgi:co-chaperonin GroES (HSP10)
MNTQREIFINRELAKAGTSPVEASKHGIGLCPVEFKVIVLPNRVNRRSVGGIDYPDEVIDQMQIAVSKGRLVAVSPVSFTYFDPALCTYDEVLERYPGNVPHVDDLVLYGRYCGSIVRGDDGHDYRIMNDKDIMAIISETVSKNESEYL